MNTIDKALRPFLCAITIPLASACAAEMGQETEPAAGEQAGQSEEALASDCENGANGFVDIRDDLSGTIVRTVDLGLGVTVNLESKTINGVQRGFAKISGDTFPNDKVWMDWTTTWRATGKFGWLQCGPFNVDDFGLSKTSAAQATSRLNTWRFRACGALDGGPSLCSSWW